MASSRSTMQHKFKLVKSRLVKSSTLTTGPVLLRRHRRPVTVRRTPRQPEACHAPPRPRRDPLSREPCDVRDHSPAARDDHRRRRVRAHGADAAPRPDRRTGAAPRDAGGRRDAGGDHRRPRCRSARRRRRATAPSSSAGSPARRTPRSTRSRSRPRAWCCARAGRRGLIHGLASLRQLAGTGREVPAVTIADGPRFPWRGVMLDCCRHYMSVEFIEDVLDLMALYKLNRFHWHLTEDQAWRLAIDRYPRLDRGRRLAHRARRQHARRLLHAGGRAAHRGLRGRPRHHGGPRDRAAGPLARGDRGVSRAVVHRRGAAGALLVGRLRGRLLRGQRRGLHAS